MKGIQYYYLVLHLSRFLSEVRIGFETCSEQQFFQVLDLTWSLVPAGAKHCKTYYTLQ